MAAETVMFWNVPNRQCDKNVVANQRLPMVPNEVFHAAFFFTDILPETATLSTTDSVDDGGTGVVQSFTQPVNGEEVDMILSAGGQTAPQDILITVTATDDLGNTYVGTGYLLIRDGTQMLAT